jgi:hypothetical protein
MRFEYQWFIVMLLGTLTSVAQQPATGKTSDAVTDKPIASATLSGHVYLSDTKGPARKAAVYLQPAAELQIEVPNDHDQGRADGAVTIGVQTRFDGSFFFGHVPSGDYYVIASCPGYVSPKLALSLAEGHSRYANQQPLAPSQQAAKEAVLKGIPRIAVQSSQHATVDVTLERGAAISGNISYDDGTPAAGLNVDLLARMMEDGKETWAGPFLSVRDPGFTPIYTDDRGDYRISGLPAGKYMIATTFDLSESITYISSSGTSGSGTNNQWTPLKIYSGNTTQLKDAAVLSLKPGEEHSGEDLQFPLSKLHTIAGHIVSAHDGHVINAGQVVLHNVDDKSLAGTASISPNDPGFTLSLIYDGEYILSSSMSADVDYQQLPQQPGSLSPPQYNSHPRHLYGYASIHLHVDGDMDGGTIAVPEPTAKEAQTFKDALQRQEQQNQSPSPNIEQR